MEEEVSIEVKILKRGEESLLSNCADGVFDRAIIDKRAKEFAEDPRHHLAIAFDGDLIVGMASAVHYIHPDKEPELWINEVGVTPAYHKRGIGKKLMAAILDQGKELGCGEAWVLTDRSNEASNKLYSSTGGRVDSQDTVMYTFFLNREREASDPQN